MPKFVFVNRFFHPDISATSQILFDLTTAVASEGYDVLVISSRVAYERNSHKFPSEDFFNNVHVKRVWSTNFGRRSSIGRLADYASFYVFALLALLRATRARDVVIALTDPPLLSVGISLIAGLKNLFLINWLQDLFPEVAERLLPAGEHRHLFKALNSARNYSLRRASTNVVIGSLMEREIRAQGIDHATVIPNWTVGPRLLDGNHRAEAETLKKKWGLDGKFVVGYSGNLGRAHDAETFLSAAKLLRAESSIVLLFIGGGAKYDELQDAATGNGLENMEFMPYQPLESLGASLSVADVHLISLDPRMEGLIVPSKLYGVLAVSRPVIFVGDSSGEIGEILSSYGCGVSVAQGESATLAAVVRGLADDPDGMSEMIKNARKVSTTLYNRENSLAAWMRVLANPGMGYK